MREEKKEKKKQKKKAKKNNYVLIKDTHVASASKAKDKHMVDASSQETLNA